MSNKQHEAVRLIRAISDCVQTHPQLTEDEPGGYCTEADQLMDEAAALLRVWSVDIERKDALLRQARKVLRETRVNPEDYDFGPAYEGAKRRLHEVLKAIKQELSQ